MTNTFANKVRAFLVDIAEKEIVQGKKYNIRLAINDGGYNSYIGLCVDTHDFMRKKPVTQSLRIFRHSNGMSHLVNTWGFDLGSICHAYVENRDIPIEFSSYGVAVDQAEAEAEKHFNNILKEVRKQTSLYKVEEAETLKEEKEILLARLSEIESSVTS